MGSRGMRGGARGRPCSYRQVVPCRSYSNGDAGNPCASPESTSRGGTGSPRLKDKSHGRSLCLGRWETGAMSGRNLGHAGCGRPDTLSGMRTCSGSLTIPELRKWTKNPVPLTFDLTWKFRDKESRGRPQPSGQGPKTVGPKYGVQMESRYRGSRCPVVGTNVGISRWSRSSMSGSRDRGRSTNRCEQRGQRSWKCLGTWRDWPRSLRRPVRQPGRRD